MVADKFFPSTSEGRTLIFCELDYFKRLDLLCGKCGMALRGAYVNALGKKFHLEHFTCSVCPQVFRQHDSYFEKDGKLFCGYHYSVAYATKCGGCNMAVLKNFVETNSKDMSVTQWHPCCYMIYKLWHVRLTAKLADDAQSRNDPEVEIERQQKMIERVELILQVLSCFEESAAECISEMLVYFSNGNYLEGALHANRFIQHVFVLFASLEEIDRQLISKSNGSHQPKFKEPKQLVKKVIYFFSVFSGNQDIAARLAATKEMISLVTSLAHTLKVIIRGSLTGAFRLEQLYSTSDSVSKLLEAFESVKAKPSLLLKSPGLSGQGDVCHTCSLPLEESCVSSRTYSWHAACLRCATCQIPIDVESGFVSDSSTLYCDQHKTFDSTHGLSSVSQLQQYSKI